MLDYETKSALYHLPWPAEPPLKMESLLAETARPCEKRPAECRARSSTDRMVVSEAADSGSIPDGRTSRKSGWNTAKSRGSVMTSLCHR